MLKPTSAALWAALSFSGLLAQENTSLNNPLTALAPAAVALNTWTQGTPMPTSRMGPFTGAIGNKVYVVGGETNTAVLNVNEIYDPAADTWSFGAPMPTARWNGGYAVVNNIL